LFISFCEAIFLCFNHAGKKTGCRKKYFSQNFAFGKNKFEIMKFDRKKYFYKFKNFYLIVYEIQY